MTIFPWGKWDEYGSHHLAHHCADVAACFEQLAVLPILRMRLEKLANRKLGPCDIERLAVFAFLHDIGKLHPEFQAKATPGFGAHRGHSGEGLAAVTGEINQTDLAEMFGSALRIKDIERWSEDATLLGLTFAVFAHHGKPVSRRAEHQNAWQNAPKGLESYNVTQVAKEIGDLLPVWFPNAFSDHDTGLPGSAAFQHFFCGLVSLADWVGSDEESFPKTADLKPDYMERSRDRAATAVRRIGLDTTLARTEQSGSEFSNVAPGFSPRPAQRVVGTWPTDDPLLVLEAETGSGKTEAALWRFARLFEAGLVDSLYFAVPTRAAAKQLHGRVHHAMKALFGEAAPEAVLAIPGYLRAGDFDGQALPNFKVLWEDGDGGARTGSRWAAENPRRFLAAMVAVGTVDQAMLSALQVKHAHLRGAALSRSLLVIDEVHASDAYMTEIQENLLDIHLARGGHAMLMSATLGSAARVRWLSSSVTPSHIDACKTAYPAVWGAKIAMRPVEPDGRRKTVAMELATDWRAQDAAQRAVQAAEAGARVLVIRNTVQTAADTFDAVIAQGADHLLFHVEGHASLHHSRFAVEDRKRLDDAVELALSPSPETRPTGGAIIVGTQTLEQSLDICADFLITDLCPADVLLQRLGRLHRHKLARAAGFEDPACVVLSPAGGLDRFSSGTTFQNGLGRMKSGQGIYVNLHACELTRRLILKHPVWTVPDMNRLLVEGATHSEAVDALNAELSDAWRRYWTEFGGSTLADRNSGRLVTLDVSELFFKEDGTSLSFPDADTKIKTRLGAEGARIRFESGTIGPFGLPISAIVCPAHWVIGEPETPVATELTVEGSLLFSVQRQEGGTAKLVYSQRGIEIS